MGLRAREGWPSAGRSSGPTATSPRRRCRAQDAPAAAQETLDGLSSDLPQDLQDDLAVVGEAFGAIAEDGVVRGASALTTSAFIEANENILGYLRNDCLPG